jgi:hypothetical protein
MTSMTSRREWLVDGLVGVLVGGVVGGIAALNFAIFSGMERGYETTIPEMFRENVLAGLVYVSLLVAGPVLGVWLMRRRRRNQATGSPPTS